MENRKCFFLVEGECEEKILKALKGQPALINPGSVKKFNVIQNEILMATLYLCYEYWKTHNSMA